MTDRPVVTGEEIQRHRVFTEYASRAEATARLIREQLERWQEKRSFAFLSSERRRRDEFEAEQNARIEAWERYAAECRWAATDLDAPVPERPAR